MNETLHANLSDKEPDYKLKGTVLSEELTLHNVLCEIYLSSKLGEVGYALFKPPSNYSLRNKDNQWPFLFSFHGEVKGAGNWTHTIIEIQKSYMESSSVTNSYTEVEETVVKATIEELLTKNITKDHHQKDCDLPLSRYFLLSPCDVLTNFKTFDYELNGEVKLRSEDEPFTLNISKNLAVTFETYYEHTNGKHNESVMTPRLIAKHELDKDWTDSYCYQGIDDFMRLVSFAARRQYVCLSSHVDYKHSFTTHKRRTHARSDNLNTSHDRSTAIIFDRKNFRNYLHIANKAFQSSKNKQYLRGIIGHTLGSWSYKTDEFLSLYSALESLVLIFKKEHKLEYILDEKEFKKLKKSVLEPSIKESLCHNSQKSIRDALYKNLKGINRTSFSYAYKAFIKHYEVHVDDLWPIIEDKGSISVIRNRLAHGRVQTNVEFSATIIATIYLRRLLERCILHHLNCGAFVNSGFSIPEEIKKRYEHSIQTIREVKD